MEARPGVEPRFTDLQSAAWPLCQRASVTSDFHLFRWLPDYGNAFYAFELLSQHNFFAFLIV